MANYSETQNLQTPENSSTQTMMQGLKPAVNQEANREATPVADFINRLNKLKLGNDPRMISLITAYPNYGNRLISLFKVLKEFNISLSATLETLISKNISHIGGVVNLLGLVKELDIDPSTLSLALLFNAAKSDSIVTQSVRELNGEGVLDLDTFELMLTYPEQSLKISQLLISLQEHAYDITGLAEKLHGSLILPAHMSTVIDLLNLMLENDTYYPRVVDLLLSQGQYIDKIYEGTKKLVTEHYPLGNYFALLQQDPQNANIFAKNILLLNNASIINHDSLEDLLPVSKLGVGAFHFMKHLQLAGMLDAVNYQKICQHNSILIKESVIETLSTLPLMAQFQKEELEELLDIASKSPVSDSDIQKFNEIIEGHFILDSCSVMAP